MLSTAENWWYVLQVAGMTKEKTQWKEFLEAFSVLQWVLTFLFLGKIPLHVRYMNLYNILIIYFATVHYSSYLFTSFSLHLSYNAVLTFVPELIEDISCTSNIWSLISSNTTHIQEWLVSSWWCILCLPRCGRSPLYTSYGWWWTGKLLKEVKEIKSFKYPWQRQYNTWATYRLKH